MPIVFGGAEIEPHRSDDRISIQTDPPAAPQVPHRMMGPIVPDIGRLVCQVQVQCLDSIELIVPQLPSIGRAEAQQIVTHELPAMIAQERRA